MFDIPIVLFTFRRTETLRRIIKRISEVKPKKMYIISDGPRTTEEKVEIEQARMKIESFINWNCEVVKNYAQENRGVYRNIGEGAKWVFEHEEKAIFLEDDNLPEITFFQFCSELLDRYEVDSRILWICGTNYMEKYKSECGASYVFTKHMLPCGWASWSGKFLKYYDGELDLLSEVNIENRLKPEYLSKSLFKQDFLLLKKTKFQIENDIKSASWDRQISFSIRAQGLYGISPIFNQIENIGVDPLSTHGGTSFAIEMTSRFCGIPTHQLYFPLTHPKLTLPELSYERMTANIILLPFTQRLAIIIMSFLKPLIGMDKHDSFKKYLKRKLKKRSSKL